MNIYTAQTIYTDISRGSKSWTDQQLIKAIHTLITPDQEITTTDKAQTDINSINFKETKP